WIIGNGANIKVMSDPWLREKDGVWVQSPQTQGAHNITVNDLMLPNLKRWDKDKIESLFPLEVANCILDIPLFDVIEEDKLIWVDSIHGLYSVKSGYNMWLNITGRRANVHDQDGWKSLWKIHAPPKAKHLLWRICKNCLPTRSRLKERCVPCPDECPLCNNHVEDDWHFLVNCSYSAEARAAAGLENIIAGRMLQLSATDELILDICRTENRDVAGQFATLVWTLWQNRNNKVWNGELEGGHRLGVKGLQLWFDWKLAQRIQQQGA
ncbi:putative ribonuclease H protein, partial [Trifolium medium]|nr:putative ribonuclease H protein [Trifolium medium]